MAEKKMPLDGTLSPFPSIPSCREKEQLYPYLFRAGHSSTTRWSQSDMKFLTMQTTETRQAMWVRWYTAKYSYPLGHPNNLVLYHSKKALWPFNASSINKTHKGNHTKWPIFFQIVTKYRFVRNIFTKILDIKRHENPAGGRRADTCRLKDRQTYVCHEGNRQFWRLCESAKECK
jgi:hypothetical protein